MKQRCDVVAGRIRFASNMRRWSSLVAAFQLKEIIWTSPIWVPGHAMSWLYSVYQKECLEGQWHDTDGNFYTVAHGIITLRCHHHIPISGEDGISSQWDFTSMVSERWCFQLHGRDAFHRMSGHKSSSSSCSWCFARSMQRSTACWPHEWRAETAGDLNASHCCTIYTSTRSQFIYMLCATSRACSRQHCCRLPPLASVAS